MKTLVTGGAGFIGSHLVERLVRDGHQVTVLDNLCTGREENLAGVKRGVTLHKVDIADPPAIKPLFKGMDWVFHLAALADVVPSIVRPGDYYHSNVSGTFAVLEASRAHQVKKVVYTASSSCYGLPDSIPTPETAEIRCMYPYALTKYLGEELLLHWGKVYKIPVISLRLFNVFGPRSRTSGTYGAVFGVFLAQKLAGVPFTVVGNGKQSRDFTFVTDIADAYVKAAESNESGEVMNVGTGKPQTINRLVELLGGSVTNLPKRPGEPDCTQAETSKIRQKLGWTPKVSFEEGVSIMLKNIDFWKTAPVWNPDSIAEATRDWFRFLGGEKT